MHLTRAGFNMAVAIWLLPLVIVDLVGNTNAVGIMSDVYYYKFMFDGLLIAFAVYQVTRPATANIQTARSRVADRSDDVVNFENIGAFEYIYCGALFVYAAVNWYFLHQVNVNSTGIISMVSLVWSFLSIAVAILSAVQFYHLKSGAIVELKKRVIQ